MQIAAATLEDGLAGGDWEDWVNEALELTSKIMSHKTPDALKHIFEALQARQEEAETAFRQAFWPVDNSETSVDNTGTSDSSSSPEGAMDSEGQRLPPSDD